MRKHCLIFIFLFTLICSPAWMYSQDVVKSGIIQRVDGKDYYLHSIEQGQTLYSLSKAYDVPVDELIFENPEIKQTLAIGQIIKVPVVSREKKITDDLRNTEFRFILHIVKKGQTLYGIAKIYDVSVDDLKSANPGWSAGLKVGQYLKIPLKDQVPIEVGNNGRVITDKSNVHIVARGETLYSISRKYQVSIPALRAANPTISNELSVGQKVFIPVLEEQSVAVKEKAKYYEHVVLEKETLYGIAKQYRTSIDSLIIFNPGLSENIFPGEVIRIPAAINQENYITHQVRENTKLKKIASKYTLSVSDMKDANPGISSRVYHGDMLLIPVGPPLETKADDVHIIVTKPDDIPPTIIKNDSIRCLENMYQKNREFKVALMIPFYAEEAREIEISPRDGVLNPSDYKSFNFIQFYEGFIMAMDELEAEGLEVQLYVYDVDEKVSKTIQVLQEPELSSMDLIIGPFFSRNFKLVSNFAEMFDIKIVNPLTRRNEVLSSPNIFKVKPSPEAQPALLAKFVKKYYRESNIILVRNNKFQYADDIEVIKSSLEKNIPSSVKVANAKMYDLIAAYSEADTNLSGTLYPGLSMENKFISTGQLKNAPGDSTFFSNGIAEVIYATDSVYGIIKNASIIRNNLVIVLSDNEIFAPEVLTRLNDLKDTFDITVVGMPEWELLSNLETDYLLDLNVYFFTDSYYNYDDPAVQGFIDDFKDRYKTHPNSFAFEGHDVASFFLGAMMRFGSDCEKCLPYYQEKLLKSKIWFAPAYPAGYENLYWNLCRYRNYKIYKVPEL